MSAAAIVVAGALWLPAFAQAAFGDNFGVAPGSFTAGAFKADGTTPDTQAGGHPDQATTAFSFNTTQVPINHGNGVEESTLAADGSVKDTILDLPPGFLGNPQATPKCPLQTIEDAHILTSFYASDTSICPADTQVGEVTLTVNNNLSTQPEQFFTEHVYNLEPEPGQAAAFGFVLGPVFAEIVGGVDPAAGYRLRVSSLNISTSASLIGVSVTLWGVPADHNGGGGPRIPFLTNPVDCQAGPLSTSLAVDSYQHPGALAADGSPAPGDPNWKLYEAPAPAVTGCEQLRFEPTFDFHPDSTRAGASVGPTVDLHVPQNEAVNQLATPELKDARVTLPAGIAVSPSAADGLQGCSDSQIGLGNNDPAACPEASKIGAVEVTTPLLEEPLSGQVFLAAPDCAPCSNADAQNGKLLRLFLQVAGSGIRVKLPGSVSADPSTGRLTAAFTQQPQLPFEDLQLHFKQGPRAPLVTPPTCGTYTTTTDLTPWSAGGSGGTPDATPSSSFEITEGPGGGPCPADLGARPLAPGLSAGTVSPVAGARSPFAFRLSREDSDQEFSSLNVNTPPGLAAVLKGVPYCPEAALAAARANGGRAEQANPSCPAASQIGTTTVGAGPGSHPFYIAGKVYLAGPYKGAPLSLAAVVPAVAGPFDLGTVVVRSAIDVDPTDAHLHVVSDPLPQILAGIPLDLRDIRVDVDRPSFTTNPTNCSPLTVDAEAFGNSGGAARVANPFQVGACGALPFAPKLTAKVSGATKRNQNPAFKATLVEGSRGEANVAFASVALPHSEFLDNAHIQTVCTRVQFAAEACPAASIYGHAIATSPLLDNPVAGPVYLRSSSNKLPDLVAALKGPPSQPIEIDLDGRIDTDAAGGIRTTFETVPDAEVSKFVLTMKGGSKGLLVNSTNLCAHTQHLTAKITAQNGKTANQNPILQNSCAKGKSARAKRSARAHR